MTPDLSLAAARFVNLAVLSALFAVLVGTRVALSPVMKKLAPVPWATVQQGTIATLGRPMPLVMVAAVLSPLPVLVLLAAGGERGGARFWLTAGGMACTIAVVASTLLGNVPLNKEVARWNAKAPPANYFQVRERWEQLHTMRSAFVSVAWLLQLGAVVWP